MRQVIPFLVDAVDFFATGAMGSSVLGEDEFLRIGRGPIALALPWLDLDSVLVLAVNRRPGDDVAIVLDYRGSIEKPLVVASSVDHAAGYGWREAAGSFDDFATALGLNKP
jgi:hypothetical protein